MFIQNVSMSNIIKGNHAYINRNTALIQIQDYGCFSFAKPAKRFLLTNQYAFDDHDDPTRISNISTEQAKSIADVLTHCFTNKINVIVHCHAGICRSGAVAEVGIIMGFHDRANNRIPNVLVKSKILNALGYKNSWSVE
jgi:protein tyrosine phosphatase